MQAKVVRTYRSAFEREIGESIWINRALKGGVELLNSKNEYNRCSIPRLGLALDNDEKIEEYKNKQEEIEIKRQIATLREKLRYGGNNIRENKRRKTKGDYIKEKSIDKMKIESEIENLKVNKKKFITKLEINLNRKRDLTLDLKDSDKKLLKWEKTKRDLGLCKKDKKEIFTRLIRQIPIKRVIDVKEEAKKSVVEGPIVDREEENIVNTDLDRHTVERPTVRITARNCQFTRIEILMSMLILLILLILILILLLIPLILILPATTLFLPVHK